MAENEPLKKIQLTSAKIAIPDVKIPEIDVSAALEELLSAPASKKSFFQAPASTPAAPGKDVSSYLEDMIAAPQQNEQEATASQAISSAVAALKSQAAGVAGAGAGAIAEPAARSTEVAARGLEAAPAAMPPQGELSQGPTALDTALTSGDLAARRTQERAKMPKSALGRAIETAVSGPFGLRAIAEVTRPAPLVAVQAIQRAGESLGVDLGAQGAEFISNLPAPFAQEPPTAGGRPRPQTLGEFYAQISEDLAAPIPEVEHARRYWQVRPEYFDSDSNFQLFLKTAQENGAVVMGKAAEFAPDSYGGAIVDAGLFATPAALEVLRGRGLNSSGLASIGKALREPGFATAAAKTVREARDTARLSLQDMEKKLTDALKQHLEALQLTAEKNGGRLPPAAVAAARTRVQPALGKESVSPAVDRLALEMSSFWQDMGQLIPGPIARAKERISAAVRSMSAKNEQLALPMSTPLRDLGRAAEINRLAMATSRKPDIMAILMGEPRRRLQSWGEKGVELARRYDKWGEDEALLAGVANAKIEAALEGLSKEERVLVGAMLDSSRRLQNPLKDFSPASVIRVAQAADRVSAAAEPVIARMRAAKGKEFLNPDGLFDSESFSPKNLFAYYIDEENPKMRAQALTAIRAELLGTPGFMNRIRRLPKGDQTQAVRDAVTGTWDAIRSGARKGRMAYPERTRVLGALGVEGFVKDPLPVFKEVISSWARRVTRTENLGAGDSAAQALIDGLKFDGKNPAYLDSIHRALTDGVLPTTTTPIAQKILAFNVYTKMGLSALRNATQFPVNTMTKMGFADTTTALKAYYNDEGKDEFIRMARSIIQGTTREMLANATGLSAAEFSGDKLLTKTLTPQQFLKAVKFSGVEEFNRVLSMMTGRYAMERNLRSIQKSGLLSAEGQLAKLKLREFGITDKDISKVAKRGTWSMDQLLRGGLKTSNATQFQTGVLDMPLFMQDNAGKLLGQFKTMPYRQSIFWYDTLRGAHGKEEQAAAIGRFLATTTAAGIPVRIASDFLQGKPLEENAFYKLSEINDWKSALQQIVANVGATTGFGLLFDIASTIAPEAFSTERFPNAGKALAGPGLSDIMEAGSSLAGLTDLGPDFLPKKGPLARFGRFATTRGLPLLGAATGNPAAALIAAAAARTAAKAAFPVSAKPKDQPAAAQGLQAIRLAIENRKIRQQAGGQ